MVSFLVWSMKLQIALDDITREAAKVLLEKIQEDVDIIEIGTPFAYYNDISVIQEFKDLASARNS